MCSCSGTSPYLPLWQKLRGSVLHKSRAASGLISINLVTRHRCEFMIKLQFHFCSANLKDERSCWRCSASICSYFKHAAACNFCLIFFGYACCCFYCYFFLLVKKTGTGKAAPPILQYVSFIKCIFLLLVGAEGFSGALHAFLSDPLWRHVEAAFLPQTLHCLFSIGDMRV